MHIYEISSKMTNEIFDFVKVLLVHLINRKFIPINRKSE